MYKIYTDTSANLPLEIMQKYDLTEIPLHYTIDGKEFPLSDTGPFEFDGKAFYDALRNGADVKTQMINTDAFCDAFESSLSKGIDIIYIGMSSGLSGTYDASVKAAEDMRERYPERKIATIDTRAASLGEGLVVLNSARLKESGASFEEVVNFAEKNSDFVCQYFTVEDLMYLKKGGRISGAVALLGNILQIKPILMGDEKGMIVLSNNERGRKRALAALANKYAELVADKSASIGIAHGDCLADAQSLAQKLTELGQTGKIIINCYEPVTGSHVGPGTVALFFYGLHR